MIRHFILATAITAGALALSGCQEEEIIARPAAVALTREAVAHYCQMTVLDHPGPKAQIHLAGNPHPVWFTQIRDAIAFTLLPEEVEEIAAIYVTDMSAATWDVPAAGNWIAAQDAVFVIESKQRGGMGAPEVVPFGDREAADDFISRHGGRAVKLDGIPKDYVLAPVDVPDVVLGVGG
ncbi:MAG: nitrous oxide reductase accessory protein NosL [Hyphomicrobiales bacterium]